MDDQIQNASGTSKNNYIWKYFDVANEEERMALCKQCNELFSYKTNIGNLRTHLERKHTKCPMKTDDEDEDHLEATYLEDKETDDIISDRRKLLRNGAWEYFQVTDEGQRQAVCRLCHEEFSYRTTSSNLTKHLKCRHFIEFKNSDEDDEPSQIQELDTSTPTATRGRVSISWDYFTIKDRDRRVATCKLCGRDCSYLTSVSNLMKHVRRKHGVIEFEEDEVEQVEEYESDEKAELSPDISSSEPKMRSSVWLYFKCINKRSRISICLICKKRLSHKTSITNLKRHLYRKHPHLPLNEDNESKKMLISTDGQLYEIEDSTNGEQHHVDDDDDVQNAEPMEIYLDEIDGNVVERSTIQPRKKRKPLQNVKSIAIKDSDNDSCSSDDEITFQKRYVRKKKDSLDQFGRYLVSLLRQVPRDVSNQLQADFVKQAMTRQVPKTVVADNGTGYAITITENGPSDVAAVTSASNDELYVVQTSLESRDS